MATIKGITIRQPWAVWICHRGKRVENRVWPPPQSMVGEYLAIHAGKIESLTQDDIDDAKEFVEEREIPSIPGTEKIWRRRGEGYVLSDETTMPMRECPSGAIVAVAKLVGVTEESPDPWFVGPYGWLLDDVRAIEPVPCRGQQGLWALPPSVLATVCERWLAAGAR